MGGVRSRFWRGLVGGAAVGVRLPRPLFWPLAATVAAFTFAFADGWSDAFSPADTRVSRPLLDVVYAIACRTAFAVSRPLVAGSPARLRLRTGHAVPATLRSHPTTRSGASVGAGAISGAALASFPVVVLLFVVVRADDRAEVAGAWSTVAVCGLVVGATVGLAT